MERVIVIADHPHYGKHGTLLHPMSKPGVANVVELDDYKGGHPVFMTNELMLESEFNGTLPERVSTVLVTEPVEVTERPSVFTQPKGKRGRRQTTLDLTPDLLDQAIVLVKSGVGMVEAATKLNLSPAKLSPALKAAGVEVKRGRKPASPSEGVSNEVEN